MTVVAQTHHVDSSTNRGEHFSGVRAWLNDSTNSAMLTGACQPALDEFERQQWIDPSSAARRDGVHHRFSGASASSVRTDVSNAVVTERLPSAIDDTQYHVDRSAASQRLTNQLHADCFAETEFPPAKKCQACHPGHYREWSVSSHAYAQLSPVFNAMSSKLNELTNGTLGDFCIRCHTPVGMAQNKPIVKSNLDRSLVEREGVTCVVCHRINQSWGRITGRQALVPGDLTEPIYGPVGNSTLKSVLADPERYGVLLTDSQRPDKGRTIHSDVEPFFALTTPSFCGACHDVLAPTGFRLEDAFSEFKQSPAAREKHQNCQDCHMGLSPGVASGYAHAPAAKVGNVWTPPRKRTNHMMLGPDYSIVHPGIFPHNPKAVKEEHPGSDDLNLGFATLREWLAFDHEKGWGTQEFERHVQQSTQFPQPWQDRARRYRARDILNQQWELIGEAKRSRLELLQVGYRLGEVEPCGSDRRGLHFRVKVCNGTDGHSVPTGFDAERLVFLRTTVVDQNGVIVFVSGDLDPNGDVRDSHSVYVHNGKLPIDRQLFSLQSRFLTRNQRGGEREQVLNVPFSLDPLPFTRPATRAFTVLGRPIGARKHKQNIEVGGHRFADYTIAPALLTGAGPYFVRVQLIAAMVPANLIHEISSVGFDYDMSAKEVAAAVVDGHIIVHTRDAVLHE